MLIARGFATSRVYELEEYMEQVEMWFRKYEMTHQKTKRQIYLATDEPQVSKSCGLYSKYSLVMLCFIWGSKIIKRSQYTF